MTPYPRGRNCSVQDRRSLSLDPVPPFAVHVRPVTLPALGEPDLARRRPWSRILPTIPRAFRRQTASDPSAYSRSR
jgi:hypothetical protein